MSVSSLLSVHTYRCSNILDVKIFVCPLQVLIHCQADENNLKENKDETNTKVNWSLLWVEGLSVCKSNFSEQTQNRFSNFSPQLFRNELVWNLYVSILSPKRNLWWSVWFGSIVKKFYHNVHYSCFLHLGTRRISLADDGFILLIAADGAEKGTTGIYIKCTETLTSFACALDERW